MKPLKYICLLSGIILLPCCTDLADTYKEFQGNGEIAYTGKIDSIVFREGFHKIQLEGLLHYSRTAKELVISWNDEEKVVDIENHPKNEKLKVLIEDMDEGLYVFNVYTLDKDKNRSVITTIQASVYGDNFIAAQAPVPYTIEATERNTVDISWGEIPALSQVILNYTDYKDVEQQITVSGNDKLTSIYKFNPGSRLTVTTCVKPNENALEYIPLEPELYDFPKELHNPEMLDRRLFRNMAMDGDAKQGHGGVVANMWDGNTETYMHTTDNVGVPCHVTIDLGEENYLVAGKVIMREIFTWCPYQFQVWGLPDVDDINLYEPSVPDNLENKYAWETESASKGWVNLTNYGSTNYATRETNNRESTFTLDKTRKVRYIKYRALKVWESEGDTGKTTEGTGGYFCTSELYLYRSAK